MVITLIWSFTFPGDGLGSNSFDMNMYSMVVNGDYSNTSMR